MSKLVIGTMVCDSRDMTTTTPLLDAWVEAGGSGIDTARVYSGGYSERAVGNWLKLRSVRDRIVLIGKGAHPDAKGSRVNPAAIGEDIATSLELMCTDYIDLYLLHRDDPAVSVGEIVDCLNQHQRSGRIRAFGGSNWTVERVRAANDYAAAHGLEGFAASSPYFGLAVQNEPTWAGCVMLDEAGWAWHRDSAFALLPWSSQAGGLFTGRYAEGDGAGGDIERVFYSVGNWERVRRARALAETKGVTANNIALAYVMDQPFPVYPIIGPRTVAELASSLPALDVVLTGDEKRWLDLRD